MESAYLIPMVTLLVRVLLGVLFFMQGYDKIFKIRIAGVMDVTATPGMERIFGKNMLRMAIGLSSWAELLGGALLILGFQRDVALILLSANMLAVGIVFSLNKPMWNMEFYFPRMAMLVFLAIIPPGWDIWSVDWMMR